MASTLAPLTIATNIAALSVSVTINGTPTTLNIKDLTSVIDAPSTRDMPLMFPKLDYITGFEPVRENLAAGTVAAWNCTYYLNYRVLYAPLMQNRSISEFLAPLNDLWAKIATAIMQGDVGIGSEEFEAREPFNVGVVNSPSEQPFYGFDMRIMVMEFLGT